MTYDIYLTQATDEAKAELAKRFEMCKCCDFDGNLWLSACKNDGTVIIHGVGYFNKLDDLPIKNPTSEKVCQLYVKDALSRSFTVILTPDVDEFVKLVKRYLE